MSVGIALLPEYLLDPERFKDLVDWLVAMPIDNMMRKQLLVEWCQYVGVALTPEMVEAVIGPGRDVYLRG